MNTNRKGRIKKRIRIISIDFDNLSSQVEKPTQFSVAAVHTFFFFIVELKKKSSSSTNQTANERQKLGNIFYSNSVVRRIYRKHLKVIKKKKMEYDIFKSAEKDVILKKCLKFWLNNTKSKSLTRLYGLSMEKF